MKHSIAVTLFIFFTLSAAADEILTVKVGVPGIPGTSLLATAGELQRRISHELPMLAKVELVPLPSDPIDALKRGELDIAAIQTRLLATETSTEALVFDLPFLFRGLDQVSLIQESMIGDQLLGNLDNNDLVGLGYWNEGMTQFFGAPVQSAADFKGLKLIGSGSDPAGTTLLALGASSTAVASSQVMSATRSGEADAFEAPLSWVVHDKLPQDSGLKVSFVNYRPATFVVVASEEFWRKLSYRIQVVLAGEIRSTGEWSTLQATKSETIAAARLKELGFNSVNVDDSQNEKLRSIASEGWYDSEVDAGFVKEVNDLLESTGSVLPDRRGGLAPDPNAAEIYFATDRLDEGDQDPTFRFGATRGDLVYGVAYVEINEEAAIAGEWNVERPLTRLELFPSVTEFKAAVSAGLERKTKHALVYVHGYNNSFPSALESAARLSRDSHFDGVTIAFSWPSDGAALRYSSDEEEVRASRNNFAEFLTAVGQFPAIGRVHVLAHSMGGRLASEAMDWLAYDRKSGAVAFNVILAAPDVFVTMFEQAVPALRKMAHRVTLYVSDADQSLACSRRLHANPRAGQGGEDILVVDGVDTIDATNVTPSTSWWDFRPCTGGHSYLIGSAEVLADLHALIVLDALPARRHRLELRTKGALPYWVFRR